MNLDDVKDTFITECNEILQKMEATLLYIEDNPPTMEHINELFRGFHTIKGSSSIFGFDYIVNFTHVVENLMDKVRNSEIPMTAQITSYLLECRDHISDLIEFTANNVEISETVQVNQERLLNQIIPFMEEKSSEQRQPEKKIQPTPRLESELTENTEVQKDDNLECDKNLLIYLEFFIDTFRNGFDPLSFLNYLNEVGSIQNLVILNDSIPFLSEMDPESCYYKFLFTYQTTKPLSYIRQAFDFVEYDSFVHIISSNRNKDEIVQLLSKYPQKKIKLYKSILYIGGLSKEQRKRFKKIISSPSISKEEPTSTTEIIESLSSVASSISTEKKIEAPIAEKKESKKKSEDSKEKSKTQPQAQNTIRIDSNKLDQLINLVGELVISGANVNQLSIRKKDSELIESSYILFHLISEIRETALKLRMVQIGETFNRFHRIVRDIGLELNKDIQLIITGGDTELDKTVVEKINDPLMHLIRNAMDHGLESKDERISVGKSSKGKLILNAYHETGSIVIEVIDDGRGINKERIFNKAVEKKIVSPEQKLTDDEIYQLMFSPGFSTAEKITNISGRGVGLDVVLKNIQSLRGSVMIESAEGKGSIFKVKLPLTLAIIDGFLVSVGRSYYVVPLDLVVECIEHKESSNSAENTNYINLRGEILPFVRVHDLFKTKKEKVGRQNILVIQFNGKKAGLLVDSLHGEIQTVIKPLGKIFSKLKGISGSSILGSGEIALILDIPSLMQKVILSESERFKTVAASS